MNFSSHLHKHPVLNIVAGVVNKHRLEAYVVGGYVRDLILGRDSTDIDFVCLGSGIDFARKVANALPGDPKVSYFKKFGTASIATGKDYVLEFVGARKESYRKDSRKPVVEDGSIKEDQNRRDFTINAIALDLRSEYSGKLIDPFNGLSDLKSKIIRTPLDPEKTFSDDPLRMMRAIRFAAQLDFDIDPETFEAIQKNASRLEIISMERITSELNKIIMVDQPSFGFKLLFQSGLLSVFFPELKRLHGVETIDGMSHKDNFYHTLQVLDNVAETSSDLWLRWAALLHDIAKPPTKRFKQGHGWTFHGHEDKGSKMVPRIFRRLRLPLDHKMEFVQKLVKLHLRPIPLVRDEITDSAIRRLLYEAGDDIDALMLLCRADITSKNHIRVKRYLRNFDVVEQKLKEVESRDHIRNFQPPISGNLVMKAFDIPPSRVIGQIKDEIKEAILEGKIGNNFAEAYELMVKIGIEKGLEVKTPLQSNAG